MQNLKHISSLLILMILSGPDRFMFLVSYQKCLSNNLLTFFFSETRCSASLFFLVCKIERRILYHRLKLFYYSANVEIVLRHRHDISETVDFLNYN